MKKILSTCILLLIAVMASAQVKVAPKLKKGDKKVYVSESVTTIAGQKPITITSETRYKVARKTADGYVLDVVTTDVQTDADKDDMMGRTFSLATEVMKDVRITLATDKDGKVTKILNYEEVKDNAEKVIDKILKEVPATPGFSTEVIKEQIAGQITEESLLKQMQMNRSPLVLNGKTITTGMEDEYLDQQGIKMKRTYTVGDAGTIQAASTINLTGEELKQMILAQIKKVVPEQTDVIQQNIDAIMESGVLKFRMDVKDVYTMQADGWVKEITSEMNSDTMGQKAKVSSTIRLK